MILKCSFNLYAAVDFVREANTLYGSYSQEDKKLQNVDRKIATQMRRQAKETVILHNKYLTKKKFHVGPEHLVHPYILDEETLKKKSKQPKFVRKDQWDRPTLAMADIDLMREFR